MINIKQEKKSQIIYVCCDFDFSLFTKIKPPKMFDGFFFNFKISTQRSIDHPIFHVVKKYKLLMGFKWIYNKKNVTFNYLRYIDVHMKIFCLFVLSDGFCSYIT